MKSRFEESARRREVVVLAGAGVSAGCPSALPGWKSLNAAIVRTLSLRLESALERPGWLANIVSHVDNVRDADGFPPEYQAQLIEEMCGEQYFRALQSLDVDVINKAHDGIAVLAKAGVLKAVVTTNFDRLIERALDAHGVNYVVAYDENSFEEIGERLRQGNSATFPVIKIHGCVSNHLSMIDTLKQRNRSRTSKLRACLDQLQSGYWLYLGFSAADLEGNPNYLGLVEGAARSAGATYVAYPGNPQLGKGAQVLMNAFDNRGSIVVADIASELGKMCGMLGISGLTLIPDDVALGPARFQERMNSWAASMSPAATGLCLAAVLEAIGQAESAARIMDRLVRKELHDERDTSDFRSLELHYGRLGAAWGRFIAVPDLAGSASNISVETMQSLLRVLDSEVGFAAVSWLACLYLWLNDGEKAIGIAQFLLKGLLDGHWEGRAPRTDEEAVDAWISAAQVCILNEHETFVQLVLGTAETAIESAKRAGDVIRVAKVEALRLLALGRTKEDVPAECERLRSQFEEAERVGDGFALGMRSLALGRWHVGAGGLTLSQTVGPQVVAQRGLGHLQQAASYLQKQGMDPWLLYSYIQQVKAYGDLHQFDNAQTCMETVEKGLDRFPVLTAHALEAVGQLKTIYGDPGAIESYRTAAKAATESGLHAMSEKIQTYFR